MYCNWIENLLTDSKGGRVYIPSNWPKQGFLDSHSISSYCWIFTQPKLTPNTNGYVEK